MWGIWIGLAVVAWVLVGTAVALVLVRAARSGDDAETADVAYPVDRGSRADPERSGSARHVRQ